jgi:hypothetical protein
VLGADNKVAGIEDATEDELQKAARKKNEDG